MIDPNKFTSNLDSCLAAMCAAIERADNWEEVDGVTKWKTFASSPALVLRTLQKRIGSYLQRACEARTYLLQGTYDLHYHAGLLHFAIDNLSTIAQLCTSLAYVVFIVHFDDESEVGLRHFFICRFHIHKYKLEVFDR